MEGIPFLWFMGESMATLSPLDFFFHSLHTLDEFNSFLVRKILEPNKSFVLLTLKKNSGDKAREVMKRVKGKRTSRNFVSSSSTLLAQ